jgi:hypothetical protein
MVSILPVIETLQDLKITRGTQMLSLDFTKEGYVIVTTNQAKSQIHSISISQHTTQSNHSKTNMSTINTK